MTWFLRGVEFFRSFLTSSYRAALGERKEEKTDLSPFPHLRSSQAACTKTPCAEERPSHRAGTLTILGLLVSMTVVAPAHAEYFYTAPRYDGWVLAALEIKGTFGNPETALRKLWDPECYPSVCYIYDHGEVGVNDYQWDGYWKYAFPDGLVTGPHGLASTIPLLSCPPGFKIGTFTSQAYRSAYLLYGLPEHQKYNAALLGYVAHGYAVCYRRTGNDFDPPSPDRAPGPPPDGSCSAVGNPCDAATGNKYEHEVDYGGDGTSALRFERYYNSVPAPAGLFGAKWRSNFDRRVIVRNVTTDQVWQFPDSYTMAKLGMQTPTIRSVSLERPDGKTFWFSQWSGGAWQSEHDIDGSLSRTASGWSYTTRDGVTETYDGSGRLTAISDRNGLTQTLSYDGSGKVRVTDAFGRSLVFDRNTVTDPAGQSIRYSYDADGNLARVDYPNGTAKLYHYDDSRFPGHLTGISHVEATGATNRYSTFTYDATGKAASTEHAGGIGRFTLSYDYPTQTTVTDAVGTQERMTFAVRSGAKLLSSRYYLKASGFLNRQYDSAGRVTCHGDRDGRATKYTYTATGQLASKTDGLNGGSTCGAASDTAARTTTYQYLSASLDLPTVIETPSVFGSNKARITIGYSGNLPISITQSGYTPSGSAVSRSITLGYNAYGQVTSIDGPRTDMNDVTTLAYYECASGGACGQLRSIANALGQTTTFDGYDPAGQLLEMTDSNGLKTSYQYDARGRVRFITQTPANGNPRVSEYRYTAAGDVAFAAFPDGRALTYEYNAARLLTAITDNLGNRIAYGYDLKGNRTQTYTYDSAGTLSRAIDVAYEARNNVSQINRGGSITKFVTDAVGNVTNEYDPNTTAVNGYSYTYNSYDRLSRLLSSRNKAYGYTYYAYDINSNLKQVKTPNSATTNYAYDDLGNLLSEVSPDRGTLSYTYDAAGNVITLRDARGITVGYSYDALNRLTQATYPDSAENIAYRYDDCTLGRGRLCTVQDAAGASDYSYDAFGNVATHRRTELSVAYTTRYGYDPGHRVTSITYPNGRHVSYTRDARGNILAASMALNGVTTPLVSDGAFLPDGLPRTRRFGNGLTDTRAYDTQGKLRELYLGNADTRLYAYDANGNLTGKQTLPEVGAYAYDALDRLKKEDRTTQATVTTNWNYDANGNRKTQNLGSYAYLASSNRLQSAPGGAITLDAAGNTLSDGSRSYTYNHAGQLSQVSGAGYSYNSQNLRSRKIVGSQATVYHYDLAGNLLAETDADGNLIRDYVWTDAVPVAQVEAGETLTYLHTDHLNTPRLGTDTQGQVVWRWDGGAFGDSAPTSSRTMNLRFPGQYWDAESNLTYNGARYYDSKTGRFISHDPIGLYYPNGLNPYVYGANNPLYWIDPSGLNNVHVLPSIIPTGDSTYPNWIIPTNDWGFPTGAYPGSTKPDPNRPACKPEGCPEILPGTYPFKVEQFPRYPKPGQPQYPAPRLGNDGTVPSRGPNPNQGGKSIITGTSLHKGGKRSTGSEGCLTLDPKYWDDFMKRIGDSGDVIVW